jgi:hypothetical protein
MSAPSLTPLLPLRHRPLAIQRCLLTSAAAPRWFALRSRPTDGPQDPAVGSALKSAGVEQLTNPAPRHLQQLDGLGMPLEGGQPSDMGRHRQTGGEGSAERLRARFVLRVTSEGERQGRAVRRTDSGRRRAPGDAAMAGSVGQPSLWGGAPPSYDGRI